MGRYMWGIAMTLVIVLVGESRGQDTGCVKQLVPCLKYLNGTKDVADSCCDPLKNVVKSDPKCLCSMISNKASNAAEKAGINITHAQMLPARCGLRLNPLSCLTTTGSPNSQNSVDNSSGKLLILPSWTIIFIATAFSLLHIFLCSNTL